MTMFNDMCLDATTMTRLERRRAIPKIGFLSGFSLCYMHVLRKGGALPNLRP